MDEMVIDMVPAKKALSNLEGGDESEKVYCATLARYLNDELVPVGIALSFSLFQHDVLRSESGYPSIQIPKKLVGYPGMVYALLALRAKQVLLGALPDEAKAAVEAALAS